MKDEQLLKIIEESNKVGRGATGKLFKTYHNKKWITIKLFPYSLTKFEKQYITIYNILPQQCKKYLAKPVDLGITKIKVNGRYKGILAYEYISGVTLRKYIENPQNKNSISKIITKVQKSLLCLWYNGYMHGDFHLDNIIVMPNGNIKIIDFSTASMVKPLSHANPQKKNNVVKWFKKEWTDRYGTNLSKGKYNPNLALFNWESMESPGIWNHEKKIIQNAMRKASVNKRKASVPKSF
jgi:serine/threonine protein kinase